MKGAVAPGLGGLPAEGGASGANPGGWGLGPRNKAGGRGSKGRSEAKPAMRSCRPSAPLNWARFAGCGDCQPHSSSHCFLSEDLAIPDVWDWAILYRASLRATEERACERPKSERSEALGGAGRAKAEGQAKGRIGQNQIKRQDEDGGHFTLFVPPPLKL